MPEPMKHQLCNFAKMVNRAEDQPCGCEQLQYKKKHTHPIVIEGQRHVYTSDTTVIQQHQLRQAAQLSPKYRPNEEGCNDTAMRQLQQILATWYKQHWPDGASDKAYTIWQAAVCKLIRERPASGMKRRYKKLNQAWRQQAKEIKQKGVAFVHEDKLDSITVVCAKLGQHMANEVMASARYEATTLTEEEIREHHNKATKQGMGGELEYGKSLPLSMPHSKFHKTLDGKPAELRPTTDYSSKGPWEAYRYAQAALQKVHAYLKEVDGAKYTTVDSTAELLKLLPPTLKRFITRDAVGFFDGLNHATTCADVAELVNEMFTSKGEGYFLKMHNKKATWCKKNYQKENPKHMTATKINWLIQYLVTHDYTGYRGKVYRAKTGTPQGAPMSSSFSNLAAYAVERRARPEIEAIMKEQLGEETTWFRYADDSGSNIPNAIFDGILQEPMREAGIRFKVDEQQARPGKRSGAPILDIELTIGEDGRTDTKPFSKKRKLDPKRAIIPRDEGAINPSTVRSCRIEYMRTAMRNSTTVAGFIGEITTMLRHDAHADLNTRKVAHEAEKVLREPNRLRYNLADADIKRAATQIRDRGSHARPGHNDQRGGTPANRCPYSGRGKRAAQPAW